MDWHHVVASQHPEVAEAGGEDGRVLVMLQGDGEMEMEICVGLNGTASRVWELLGSRQPFPHLLASLTEEFDVSAEQGEQDVKILLQKLADAGFVILEEKKAPAEARRE